MIDVALENAVPDELVEVIRRYEPRFEVAVGQAIVDDRRASVRYEVKLYALTGAARGALPSSPESVGAWDALRRLAEWAMRDDGTPVDPAIRPFERALVVAPEDPGRDEVELDLRISDDDALSPLSRDEERCVAVIVGRLRRLGLSEGQRRSRR